MAYSSSELNVYYGMAEKLLHTTTDYAKGSSMQNILLKRLHANGILEANDMPVAFDMTPSHQGEVHSNPWFSSINALAAAMFDRPYDLAVMPMPLEYLWRMEKLLVSKCFLQIKKLTPFGQKMWYYLQVL